VNYRSIDFLWLFFIFPPSHRFNDYGVDGGLAAKAIRPKFDAFLHKVDSQVGFNLPEIDVSLSCSLSQYQ
jgi:hypothetical protein